MIVSKGGKNIYPGPIEDRFKSVQCVDQIMVVGEGREFLSALVVPDADVLANFAAGLGLEFESLEQLYEMGETQELFTKEFKTYARDSAAHEKIRDFRLIAEPFSVEAGTMTPTLKLRRSAIEKQYAALIDEIYKDIV